MLTDWIGSSPPKKKNHGKKECSSMMVQLAQRDNIQGLGCELEQVLFCWGFVFLPSLPRDQAASLNWGQSLQDYRKMLSCSSQRLQEGGKGRQGWQSGIWKERWLVFQVNGKIWQEQYPQCKSESNNVTHSSAVRSTSQRPAEVYLQKFESGCSPQLKTDKSDEAWEVSF